MFDVQVDLSSEEILEPGFVVHYAMTKHAEFTMCGLNLLWAKEHVARSPHRDHVTCDKCRMRIS